MARKLVVRSAAERDLAAHVEYFWERRPPVARRFLVAAYDAFGQLERLPEMGWRRAFRTPGLEHVRVRRIPGFRRYLIVYRLTDEAVEVLRVLHAAQDIRRVLEDG